MSDADAIDWTFVMGRVRGRLIDATDCDLYRNLYAAPEVMAHIGATMSVEAATETFQKALGHNRDPAARARYWQITDARCDEAVGMVALVRAAQAPTHAELGVMLLPRWQNRGVGLPALAGVVDGVIHGRWLPGIDRLIGRHAIANPNAGRLTAVLGFDRQPDDDSDHVSWWLDRATWNARWDAWPRAARNLRNSPKKES